MSNTQIITQQIKTQVNTEEIRFRPRGQSASFEITATNYSDRLASFWLEVTAAGVNQNTHAAWYRVVPGVSTLNPPGDSTRFQVTILESPIPGFIGQINLTAKIFSLELRTVERQMVRLIVEREEKINPVQISLLNSKLSFPPASVIEIPLRMFNSSQKPISITLSLVGINPEWFKRKTEQSFNLLPEQSLEASFQGQLPPLTELLAEEYSFKIETLQANLPKLSFIPKLSVGGSITILPQGTIQLECDRLQQQIPAKRPWLPNWHARSANYQFKFTNFSNLNQQVSLLIADSKTVDGQFEITPQEQELHPGDSKALELVAKIIRPWWGWRRNLDLEVAGTLSDSRVEIDRSKQNIALKVYPVFPLWLQGIIGLLLLGGVWWLWLLIFHLPPHQEGINAIEVNGLADRVISVSNDRSIRSWQIKQFRPRSSKILATTDQSIRSVRYQPVNNNRVAIGLQNGEVQLWDLLSKSQDPLLSLVDNRADRVLSLEFTQDSRFLFSGHGSGLIMQWDLTFSEFGNALSKSVQNKQLSPPSAIYGLELVGKEQNTLAIAGQYNDLLLWNWQQDRLSTINYRQGGEDDYITGLATAEQQPFLLATGDNQGAISLWNLRPCLTETVACELIDFWHDGHGETPIRSVALGPDGCYLASSGDDGKLKLWSLDTNYKRQPKLIDGAEITQLKSKINSIDLKVIDSQLQITTGGDDGKVRVFRQDISEQSCRGS